MTEKACVDSARTACERIVAAMPELQWQWDGRFGAAVAGFGAEFETSIRSALETVFETGWSATEIGDAPAGVVALAEKLGGLRGGQLLFVTKTGADVSLFCAWWPWGNGMQISIRIGSSDSGDLSNDDLKSCFGLAE